MKGFLESLRSRWVRPRSEGYRIFLLAPGALVESTGYEVPKPEVIFRLEQGEEPWMSEGETPHQSCSGIAFRFLTSLHLPYPHASLPSSDFMITVT
ncbi:hypothetical protein CB1_001592013 [Camelus ferus]|nr:hypothetical protein CB1_001592013 [Camelus ferus]